MTVIATRIQEITLSICEKLDTIQTESLQVGALLNEANTILQDEGKKQADFVAYCKENFSIGKSQAYKLMRVSKFFAEDNRFSGVAMRVLYVLATEANEDEVEKAAELAANGSLNTGTLNAILHPEPVVQKAPEAPKQTPEQVQESKEETEKSLNSLSVTEQMNVNDALQEANAPLNTEEVIEKADEASKAIIEGQRKEIETLNTMLKQLQETISKLNDKADRKPVAPVLPQFKHKCAHVVLGLTEEEAQQVTNVRKAFRELIKCGYGEGHEAFELLTQAKDKLLAK